jgi:hypothetical protein
LAANVQTATSTNSTDGIVQSTSKFLTRESKKPLRHQDWYCDTRAHVTHLVDPLHTPSTAGNPTKKRPLALLEDIAAIAELESHEDAIMMARDEIGCLDDMSLEGDIADDVSDNGEDGEKALFTGN